MLFRSTSLSQWSVSFRSRYALRQLSGFSYSQNQQADGSWLITLTPPRWGCRLAPGASVRSYLQGVLPAATRLGSLSASQVLIGVPGTGSGAGSAPGTGPGAGSGLGPGTAAGSGSGSGSGSESTGTGSGGGSSTGTSGGGGGPLPAGGLNSGNSADRLWGERFFAPYVDMGLYPVPDLDGLARQHGVGLFCLGFKIGRAHV